ncbi:MAG: hypothetical protein Fur0022_44190 [Anaerolineales bacterium]
MALYTCSQCDWTYQTPDDPAPGRCPHCWAGTLTPVDDPALPPTPAEKLIPFNVSNATLDASILSFARGIPFPPKDLTPANLRKRLQSVYLPMYLVDADVEATWQAEMGFNYEVVSHREYLSGQNWQTQQVKETRVRWEPRVGRLTRKYHNIPAPALEEHAQLLQRLGEYDHSQAKFYAHEKVDTLNAALKAKELEEKRQRMGITAQPVGAPKPDAQPLIRLPSRSTTDAWPDALPGLQSAAADECRKAGNADHVREFRWQAAYTNQNWTQLHLPLYTTYYLDDDNRPQPVLLNGQTGRLSGARRASMKRAQMTALWILLAAALVFGISVVLGLMGVAFPPLLIVGGIGVFVAFAIALGAIYPVFRVWQFNKR